MQLTEATKKKLQEWIGPSNWDSRHPADLKRWYEFVDQYQRDHGYAIKETELQEYIEQHESRLRGSMGDHQRSTIRDRIYLAMSILEFLKYTGR